MKRNLFAELKEGMAELAAEREGKLTKSQERRVDQMQGPWGTGVRHWRIHPPAAQPLVFWRDSRGLS